MGGLNGKGKVDEVSWGFGPPDCPPSRKSKKHTSEQLGGSMLPKENITDENVGVEVERSLGVREINCVLNDGSERSL